MRLFEVEGTELRKEAPRQANRDERQLENTNVFAGPKINHENYLKRPLSLFNPRNRTGSEIGGMFIENRPRKPEIAPATTIPPRDFAHKDNYMLYVAFVKTRFIMLQIYPCSKLIFNAWRLVEMGLTSQQTS